jgi:tartrate dehydrogenase/decarboxylase/D-malate dehydrogenase
MSSSGIASANDVANGTAKKLRIAVIPGEGVGAEVMPEGVACMKAAAKR